jgi:uncharacterized membrane protein YqjE
MGESAAITLTSKPRSAMGMFEETSSLVPGFDRLQSSAAAILRGADHRSELASIELGEAREQATGISVLFLVGGVAALLTGFAINLLVAALWWDTPHRLLAIGIAVGAQAAIAVTALVISVGRARQWHPFPQTFEQLRKDTRCLQEILNSPRR